MAPNPNDHSVANLRFLAVADATALCDEAVQRILDAAAAAIAQRGEFHLVLAGGSTPRAIYHQLATVGADWERWQIWFGDERCLPPLHPDRNSIMAGAAWLDHSAIPRANIHPIPAELGPIEGALAYAQEISAIGAFDLVLLGLGEDGHTASLFPDQDWSESAESPAALAVFNAPKPPPERISLSARRLSHTRAALFLVDGEGKRQALAAWRAGATIPATAVKPEAGVDVLVVAGLLVLEAIQT